MIFYCQSQVEQNFLWDQNQKNFKLTDQYLKNSRQEFFLKKLLLVHPWYFLIFVTQLNFCSLIA